MQMIYHVMSSPLGLLFLGASQQGLRLVEFMDRRSIKRVIARHERDLPAANWTPSLLGLKAVVDQLDAYFCGGQTLFELTLDLNGTPFQLKVWKELQKIPYAETRTYGEIAKAVGQPRSARAVGLASNQNPIPIIVPCHRVIGASGSLTGYGGGLQRKKTLLQLETRFSKLESLTGTIHEGWRGS